MKTRTYVPLIVIVAVYFALGGLAAVLTPPWQVPDEPAHYNYTRQLAQTGAYPVIAPGDYDSNLIGTQIAPPNKRPTISLDSVQYEDHQPPLFYTLAVPIFWLFNGALIPLRLFSLLIGALTVVFAWLAVRAIFPAHTHLASFAAVFVALLPQHLHIMSGFNNDSLSEALIALTVWLAVRYIHQPAQARSSVLALLPLAIVTGLAFLTKAQAYLALPVAVFAVVAAGYRRQPLNRTITQALVVASIAALIGLPWWWHSLQVYGGSDFLGLQTHNLVVAGQPTTAEWIVQYSWAGLLSRMAQFTFQSFWAQFGWMSITIDPRLYMLLLAVTGVSAVLFMAWWFGRKATGAAEVPLTSATNASLTLLALLALGALLGFIWYNLQFVQHQGRYLYGALIPIATALALGWHWALGRIKPLQRWLPWLWVALLVAFIALDAHLIFRVMLPAMRG